LSVQLLHVQDKERQRITREIHDGIGQYVAGLSLALGKLRACIDDPNPDFQHTLSECSGLIKAASREIRSISYLLHPPMMNEMGLKSALQWLVKGYRERSEISVSFEASPNFARLQPEIEMTLFRIAQESLSNVHRHSDSLSAVVRLLQKPDEVILEVSDRGKGMPSGPSEPMAGVGVGIRGMQERVRELKGRFYLESSPNQGVTVRVALPMA
jgi:signal transduction histidine kinase